MLCTNGYSLHENIKDKNSKYAFVLLEAYVFRSFKNLADVFIKSIEVNCEAKFACSLPAATIV